MDASEAEALDWDPGPTNHFAPSPSASVSHAEPASWDDPPWDASAAAVGTGDPAERVAELETALGEWQRRAVIWRERALSAQTLNDALRKNLEDLRVVLHGDSPLVSDMVDRSAPPAATTPATQPQEQWWTRVFRRDFWVQPR